MASLVGVKAVGRWLLAARAAMISANLECVRCATASVAFGAGGWHCEQVRWAMGMGLGGSVVLMRGGGGVGMEVSCRWAGTEVGTTLGELGSMSARAGGAGRWSGGGSGGLVVDVLAHLAKRF